MAARLPTVGGDDGNWGQILNDFLRVDHNDDGSLKASGTLNSYLPKMHIGLSSSAITETLVVSEVAQVDASSANCTRILPLASNAMAGSTLVVKKIDVSTHTVTVVPSGADTIVVGGTSRVLFLSGESVEFISDGISKWIARSSDVPSAMLNETYASPAGVWSSGIYGKNAIVTYNSSTYRSKISNNSATPGTDATKWELWGENAPIFSPSTYGSIDSSGIANSTIAIQGALNAAASVGGGIVFLGPGTYLVSGLTIDTGVILRGSGRSTVIKLANSANTDVIITRDFATLTGTNASSTAPYHFGIQDLEINGNKGHQSSSSFGLRIYGYDYDLHGLVVHHCYSTGIYSEWGLLGIITPDSMEARVSDVKVHDNSDGGIHWLGPHDSRLDNVQAWYNGPTAGAGGYGIWIDSNSSAGSAGVILKDCHVYGPHVNGIIVNDTIFAEGCESEGATTVQVIFFASGSSWRGGAIFDPTGGNSAYGIQIGDATHSVASTVIDTLVNNCLGGALYLSRSGGRNIVTIHGSQNSGNAIAGTANATDTISVYAANGVGVNLPDGPLVSGYSINVLGAANGFYPWLIGDTYKRADNASAIGYPDYGGTYYVISGTAGIISNHAYAAAGTSTAVIIDSVVADGYFEILVDTYNTQASLMFRSDGGGGTHWRLRMDGSGILLFQVTSGVLTQVGDANYGTYANNTRLGVLCQGNTVTVYVNGIAIGNPVVSSFQQTATIIGWRAQTTVCRLKNLIARRLVNGS